jgi:tetratricopeptide (TPR) repeat protein
LITYARLKNYEDAIKCYDKALEINPANGDVLYNRAASKVRTGKIKDGMEDLSEAIKIDKRYIFLAREDMCFRNMKDDQSFKELTTR